MLVLGCATSLRSDAPSSSEASGARVWVVTEDGAEREIVVSPPTRAALRACGLSENATLHLRLTTSDGRRTLEIAPRSDDEKCILSALAQYLPKDRVVEPGEPPPSNFTGQLRVDW